MAVRPQSAWKAGTAHSARHRVRAARRSRRLESRIANASGVPVDRRRSRLPDAPHPPDAYPARTSRAVLYFLDSTPSALPLDGQKRDRLLRTWHPLRDHQGPAQRTPLRHRTRLVFHRSGCLTVRRRAPRGRGTRV